MAGRLASGSIMCIPEAEVELQLGALRLSISGSPIGVYVGFEMRAFGRVLKRILWCIAPTTWKVAVREDRQGGWHQYCRWVHADV